MNIAIFIVVVFIITFVIWYLLVGKDNTFTYVNPDTEKSIIKRYSIDQLPADILEGLDKEKLSKLAKQINSKGMLTLSNWDFLIKYIDIPLRDSARMALISSN
jgi:hypothetical protein